MRTLRAMDEALKGIPESSEPAWKAIRESKERR